jgi:glycosyltransferase involved in cell wall biosynthesis
MRILKVTQAYYPFLEKGGPAVKVRAIAERLAQRGHATTVLSVDFGLERRATFSSINPEKLRGRREARIGGVEVIYLPTVARYRTLTLNLGARPWLRSRLGEFDLVHIYGLYDLLGPAAAHFCRRMGIPYVVEPIGMFQPIVRNIRLKQLYHRWLGRELLGGARRLIATSTEEAQELENGGLPAAKVVVRRNGIEVPSELPAPGTFRRQWQIPSSEKLVLFLGRLVAKKSPDLLLRAFAQRAAAGGSPVPARLVLAGPDEGDGYRRQLESLTAELGLQQRVLFTGPLYEQAKWSAYRDADLFVLPSQSENFGNTVAEAVACGTPVLITDRCGIARLVGARAGLVLSYGLEPLAAGLTKLLGDDTLRARLRAGCEAVAREFSWDEPIAQMEKLYEQVLAEKCLR